MRDAATHKPKFTKLAKVADPQSPIVYGIVQPGPDLPDGVAFVQSRDVGGKISLGALNRTSPEIANQYRRSRIHPGDILFSLRGNIGQSSLVPPELEGANIARGVARIRVAEENDPEYIRYVLQGSALQKLIARNANGSTFREISIDELRKLPIPDVPLPEQRKIAEILRTWDEALEKLTTLHAAKERRFVAITQRLLAPSRAIGRHIPPSNWKLTSFGEVFDERKDRNTDLEADDAVTVGKYAIRKQSEHFSRSVASKDLSNYWVISPGDFVYDPMSAYYGALGRYTGRGDGIVSPAYRVIRLKSGINPNFMVHILRSHAIRFLLETRSSQGNKEGKRRLLSRDEFASVEFNLPDIELQKEIAGKISLAEKDLALTTAEIEALARQKRGLMQKLLAGEWSVKPEGAVD